MSMRFLLIGVLAGFLLANTSVVSATDVERNCVCMRGYTGFSILLISGKVELMYVVNGDTEKVAGREAIHHPFFLMMQSRNPKPCIFPFSVLTLGTQTADVIVDWDTGVVTNKETGNVDDSVRTNEKGNSAWFPVCSVCGQKKRIPMKRVPKTKGSFQYINFP